MKAKHEAVTCMAKKGGNAQKWETRHKGYSYHGVPIRDVREKEARKLIARDEY